MNKSNSRNVFMLEFVCISVKNQICYVKLRSFWLWKTTPCAQRSTSCYAFLINSLLKFKCIFILEKKKLTLTKPKYFNGLITRPTSAKPRPPARPLVRHLFQIKFQFHGWYFRTAKNCISVKLQCNLSFHLLLS